VRHWQNLNDKRGGGQGSGWRHGRAWWGRLSGEWCHFRRSSPGFAFRKSDSGNLHLHLGIWFAQWFLSIAGVFKSSKCDREISVRAHDGNLWLRFWGDPDDSSRDHQLVLHVDDWVLGRHRWHDEELSKTDVLIPMPEGCYPATVTMQRRTSKRPRWFSRTFLSADVNIPGGIPCQGKGENSWDCGDDGLFGMYCQANSVEEAIGKVVASSLKDRRRYGQTSETRDRVVFARAEF
jgi:hypothetical protein